MSDWDGRMDFAGKTLRNVDFTGARINDASFRNATISADISGLVVNDIEVAPLIAAEMDRRYPERQKLHPTDADGCRAAIAVLEEQYGRTLERAERLTEAQRHERVHDEWSLVESLRHVIFVIDQWYSRSCAGVDDPFHPIALPPTFLPPKPPGTSIDPDAAPTFAQARDVLADRLATLKTFVGAADAAALASPVDNHAKSVLGALWVIFDELWAHNRFANRDLDVIEKES